MKIERLHFSRAGAVALLLLAVGFAIYGYSLGNAFLFDDETQVVGNGIIHSLNNWLYFFKGSTYANGNSAVAAGIYFKPITVFAYALLWQVFGEAWGFHLIQLLLAIANAFLVFRFLRRSLSTTAALIAALIFLSHPINTETIAYIGDLQDVLYTFFGLSALELIASRERLSWSTASGVAFLLFMSLLSKESGLLFLTLSVMYCLLLGKQQPRRVAGSVLAALGAYLFLRLGVAHMSTLVYQANQIGRADFIGRLLTAPLVTFTYLAKFFAPLHFTTTQDWIVDDLTLAEFWLPLFAMSALLAGLAWNGWRLGPNSTRGRVFAFFALWLLGGLLFHSHIFVPLDGTFADRWFYFPCIGLVGLLGFCLDQLCGWKPGEWNGPRQGPVLTIALTLTALLGWRSFTRALDWADGYTLSLHDVEFLPKSYSLLNNLGTELFRRGQIMEAKVQFERSTEVAPFWDVNWNNLGAVYYRLGDRAKAEEYYLRAITNGDYLLGYENYTALMIEENKWDKAREIIEQRAIPHHISSDRLNYIYRVIQEQKK